MEKSHSICGVVGVEGKRVEKNSWLGNCIGVFTSGGDSQGMNAAVRSIVRMGVHIGCKVYLIKEGYEGMIDGGENIVLANWTSVSNIIQTGGTIIGSARSKRFREKEGRLQAALNLIKLGITNLVCIGGDGSLTGANLFRIEWSQLLQELLKEGKISKEDSIQHTHLNIVGLVGSIDNDFCGTDMTIGTDTALHRIMEAIDNISTTACSHQRCFVMEVMGRHCGYLALVAGICSEADMVFMPECPPDDGWQDKLCAKLAKEREAGQRLNIIIVSEGAIDLQGNPITSDAVMQLISGRMGYDTRVTILGHVQRGGHPSAFDRILGCRMGAEAVMALMDASPSTPPCVISLSCNQTLRVPLMECVERTKEVQAAMNERRFELAVQLRGKRFVGNLRHYQLLNTDQPLKPSLTQGSERWVGVMMVGAPACGMNAAVSSYVRVAISKGYRVQGIYCGFEGLVCDKVHELTWRSVHGWTGAGGARLKTTRSTPSKLGLQLIADKLKKFQIDALLVVGGFEAYTSVLELYENRSSHPPFCIPLVCIPATISNNVPGTDFSLGSDTSLNAIVSAADRIKQSASGTLNRVFVLEVMGGYCGYLATLSALASGADAAYIYEETFGVEDLLGDVRHLEGKIRSGVKRGMVLTNEKASQNYSSEFITKLYEEEGGKTFQCRLNVLGHMQQGGTPSPFDRNLGTKMAAKAADFITNQLQEALTPQGVVDATTPNTATLMGLQNKETVFTPVIILKNVTDFKHRIPQDNWWLKLRPLMRILAMHDSLYVPDNYAYCEDFDKMYYK